MLSPSLSHAHPLGRLRPFLCQVISILLVSTTSLMSQQSPAQKPANPTSGSKVAEGKSAEEKPQPDESASAMAALAQLNNALEGLATKVSPAVVQILVTGYGPLHEETRTQTALIVRQHAVGSGVIVDSSGYIMTNAHVVEGAQRIRVALPLPGDSGRAVPVGKRHILEARLVGVHKDTDLALLKIDEKDLPTLPLLSQQRPRVGQLVFAIGSPEGLQNSVTMGVVSAVARQPDPEKAMTYIQTDAPINPGNSGGPAVAGDKMIGLAFSHLGGAENIGYIIPCEEIELFLQDIADGHYDGKPAMFDYLQTLENLALRPFLKLDKSVEGVVVHQPDSTDPAYPLKEWDVVTKIGDTPVDDEGMIKLGANLRVRFQYLVQKIARNGKVPLTVIHAGKELQVQLPVTSKHATVIPDLEGAYPSYFAYGPLVFSSATTQFVGGLARGNAGSAWMSFLSTMGSPLLKRIGDKPAFEGEGLVVVSSPFFPHKLSKGYSNPMSQVVKTVNGINIKNLGHLVQVLRDSKDEFIAIEFDSRGGETLVFPRAEMVAATDEVLSDNGVRSQGSPDTLAIWNAKPSR